MGDLIERLRTMCSHRGDGIATQFVNPDGPEAADRIEVLRDALTNLAEAARNTVGQRADPSLTEALAEADYAALIQTEVP